MRKARYFSRREELSDPDLLSAIISRRDYYTDAWWMVAVATTTDAPYSLEQLQGGLRHPVFRFIWGEKVIRWHYHLRRYCLKATRLMFYVTHITSIRSISTT